MRILHSASLVVGFTVGFTAVAALAAAQQPAPPAPAVHVGQAAPDFELAYVTATPEHKFETHKVKLSDFKDKKNVVIAFFPAAFSPGCTSEMAKYAQQTGRFNKTNTDILGMSVDSMWANMAFREKLEVPFPILSDAKKDVAKTYGVYDEAQGTARRTTFVVDKSGVIQHIDMAREALDPNTAAEACELMVSVK